MRLTQPTDFLILEALSDGKRNTAPNIAHQISKKRAYVNTRLPHLCDHRLVSKVGVNPNSGLYRITPLGVAAVENRSLYDSDRSEFESAVDDLADRITITGPVVTID